MLVGTIKRRQTFLRAALEEEPKNNKTCPLNEVLKKYYRRQTL